MVRIVWDHEARTDLKDIYDYIKVDSAEYAKSVVVRIRASTKALSRQREIGRIVPELEDPSIREIIQGNYRIIYQIANKQLIRIIAVIH